VGEKRVGTLAPVTARCKVGFVGLLRGRSRCARADPSVPRPECTRKCRARWIGPRIVTTSSRERVRVVRSPLNVMARLSKVVGRNGTRGVAQRARISSRRPDSSHGQNSMLKALNWKSKSGNGFRGWKICGLGSGVEECALNALRCSGIIVRCSEIIVISVFRGSAPEVRRETFVTSETYFGKPNRLPEGCLKLVPRSWWSLGACRPVLRGRLLVSGANPGSSVRKGIREGSGCPGLSNMPRKCTRTCHWLLWH
ncbi:hypothetical protein CRG98_044172, partial [Punica granatum]